MIRTIAFFLFLFFTSAVFSQTEDSTTTDQVAGTTIKNSSAPKLRASEKSEVYLTNDITKNNSLSKPEIKSFAVNHSSTASKKQDSIIISKPELIPYTGYKKKKDN